MTNERRKIVSALGSDYQMLVSTTEHLQSGLGWIASWEYTVQIIPQSNHILF